MAINVTLTRTKMTDGTTKLKLVTPYSPELPAQCRALGGKWSATEKAWFFDERDAQRVRSLCLEAFGIDPLAEPDEAPELVTVRLNCDAWNLNGASFWLFGRELASRGGRDYPVRLGDGVVVVAGGFPGSGGSRANPAMMAHAGTILEVRDVPRPLVDEQVLAWRKIAEQRAASLAKREAEAAGQDTGGLLEYHRRDAEAAKTAIVVVDAPAVSSVPIATQQFVALAKAMQPGERRTAVMSVLGALEPTERRALLKEITAFLAEGAI